MSAKNYGQELLQSPKIKSNTQSIMLFRLPLNVEKTETYFKSKCKFRKKENNNKRRKK